MGGASSLRLMTSLTSTTGITPVSTREASGSVVDPIFDLVEKGLDLGRLASYSVLKATSLSCRFEDKMRVY